MISSQPTFFTVSAKNTDFLKLTSFNFDTRVVISLYLFLLCEYFHDVIITHDEYAFSHYVFEKKKRKRFFFNSF